MARTILIGVLGFVLGVIVGVGVIAPLGLRQFNAGGQGAMAGAGTSAISFGTGGVTGVYYPAGGAICLLVNKGRAEHGIRCSVESTGGSLANIMSLRDGSLNLGIVQSDWQHHAYQGTSAFGNMGAFGELRTVFSLHPEPFTVVARADSGIRVFNDLKGKRVNIGNPGSGQRATMEVVMNAMGWPEDVFATVYEMKSADQAQALCAGIFDAMIFTVGHPSASIKEATSSCDSVMISVTGPPIDRLVRENEYYRSTVIPGGMYRGNTGDVATFGVSATVVTSASASADVIYTVVKSVFENLDTFKTLHPALKPLVKQDMIKSGLTAPLHEGAIRYFREAGLM